MKYSELYYILQKRIFNLYTCSFCSDSDCLYDFTLIVRELSHAKTDEEITYHEYCLLSSVLISVYNLLIAKKFLPV